MDPRTGDRFQLVLALVLLLFQASATRAQEQRPAPIMVPWTAAAGLAQAGSDGEPQGFFVELSRAIGELAGFEVAFREYESVPDAFAAQASGETQMLSGVAQVSVLSSTNVFSDPVAESTINLFVRSDESFDVLPETMADRRIGSVAQIVGTGIDSISDRNEIVEYPDQISAFGALLVGDIDGVVTRYTPAANMLTRARLDHRFRVAGQPLKVENRVIAIHESRAQMLPAVNAALRDLRARGELQDMLIHWNIIQPEPVPDTLRVGVSNFPPYQVVTEDGRLTGFGVEALRHLAERAGLTLSFREVSSEDWGLGPGGERFDMLPPLSVNADRERRMDFTRPIQRSPYSIFTRRGETLGISGLQDLAGMSVGIAERSIARPLAEAQGNLDLTIFSGADDLLDGLLNGRVEAILYPTITVRRLAERGGFLDEIEEVPDPFMVTERAIALRFGLGIVRERLNGVIPGYLSSEEFADLREQWLGEPDFWTPERRRNAAMALGVLSALVLLAFLVQSMRARHRAERLAAETRAVSNRLGAILDAAQSGIVGLTGDGHVAVANLGARRLLGVLEAPTPFDWPSGIDFVDPADMSPLGATRSPIKRALAGAYLRGETSLMRHGERDSPRYVRISSAPVPEHAPADVTTVVILDDVTEQERTRQQAERSGRLDALGQLTGGIAHDFNNILATIEYGIELAATQVSGKAAVFLDTARSSVRRGAELTGRLLAFAKAQPGIEKTVPVNDVIAEFRKLAAPTIERSIDLDFVESNESLTVYCDVNQLENALLNLVLNSRDAIVQSGVGDRITVQVRALPAFDTDPGLQPEEARANWHRPLAYVEFSVTDNGPGMSDEVKRRATDPFFTTKDKSSGTGLGLSMVFGFVQQARGGLRIYSELGHGTTIRMILPRGDMDDQLECPAVQVPLEKGDGQRILIVEDEPQLLDAISQIVRSMNYDVLTAASGREALDLVKAATRFDLLLTDVVMPGGVSGFDLARAVRESWPSKPVVYMSGYAGIQEREMGDVVAPTLQKPCPPAEIARTLRRALNGS